MSSATIDFSAYRLRTAIKFRNERERLRRKKGRATLSWKCRRRRKNCFIRKDRERNDLAIARSRMLEHRDKGRTILEWEKRTNLLPRSAGIKETICKLAFGVTHTELRFRSEGKRKHEVIVYEDPTRQRESRDKLYELWNNPASEK